jgi:hypothetical protein
VSLSRYEPDVSGMHSHYCLSRPARLKNVNTCLSTTYDLQRTYEPKLNSPTIFSGGTRWWGWFRHGATNLKVEGSIPDGVIRIYHWNNSSGRIMAVGVYSASNRNKVYFLGDKRDRFVWLITLPPPSGSLNLLDPPEPVQGLLFYHFLCSPKYI